MTDESASFRERQRQARSATSSSTAGPAVNITVKDARSKSLNRQPQHPVTGRFVKRNGGRRGQ